MLDQTEQETLGADLRALRKARGLTLADLSAELGRSVGWLSQVERDISVPDLAALRAMARVFDVSVSSLTQAVGADPDEVGLIVRQERRRPIGSRGEGLTEGRLSPELTDDFEMLHSTFAPGSGTSGPVSRQTQEVGYIVSGQLDVSIAGRTFSLSSGDSFRLRGQPFEWRNPGPTETTAIWVIAPPVY